MTSSLGLENNQNAGQIVVHVSFINREVVVSGRLSECKPIQHTEGVNIGGLPAGPREWLFLVS